MTGHFDECPRDVLCSQILSFLKPREAARLRLCSSKWKHLIEKEVPEYWEERIEELHKQYPSLLRRQKNVYSYRFEHHHCPLSLPHCMNRKQFCSSLFEAFGAYQQSPHTEAHGWGYIYDTLLTAQQVTASTDTIQPVLRRLYGLVGALPCRNFRHYTPVHSEIHQETLTERMRHCSFERWQYLFQKAFRITKKAQRQRFRRQYQSHPHMSEAWGLWRRHLGNETKNVP